MILLSQIRQLPMLLLLSDSVTGLVSDGYNQKKRTTKTENPQHGNTSVREKIPANVA
jgi:hypothetical protein